jgi:hypothetical protein
MEVIFVVLLMLICAVTHNIMLHEGHGHCEFSPRNHHLRLCCQASRRSWRLSPLLPCRYGHPALMVGTTNNRKKRPFSVAFQNLHRPYCY